MAMGKQKTRKELERKKKQTKESKKVSVRGNTTREHIFHGRQFCNSFLRKSHCLGYIIKMYAKKVTRGGYQSYISVW